MSEHLDMRAIDPPGKSDRRWKCLDCGMTSDLDGLMKDRTCTGPKKDQDTRLLDALEENHEYED